MDNRRQGLRAAAAVAPDVTLLSSRTIGSLDPWNRYVSPPTIFGSNGSDAGTAANAETSKSKSAKSLGIFQLPSSQQQSKQPSAALSSHSDEWLRSSVVSETSSTVGNGDSGKQARYMTLVFQDKETVLMMPQTYNETERLARNWVQPPEGASLHLRVPVEYVSLTASRFLQGPYLWIANEETYQIATHNVHGIRVEVMSEALPQPDSPPTPPQPPITDMPCEFNLELSPGRRVALNTTCSSDALDMSRAEDGTLVSGQFWGCLNITHDFNTSPSSGVHEMSFTGTRNPTAAPHPISISLPAENLSMLTDDRSIVTRPATLKSSIKIKTLKEVYFDLAVGFSPMWKLTGSWPPAEEVQEFKSKWFIRASPGGAMEHFKSGVVVNELFYEATPDVSSMPLHKFITPSNGFALPLQAFLIHISKVLDSLGLSLRARSNFISSNYPSFAIHSYIAYRFMSPKSINRAIELSIS
ncbi:hypothetical protein FRB97_002620, partial [Tulasnella sp. 331]